VTIKVPALKPEQVPKLDIWLRSILWESKIPELSPETDSISLQESQNFEIYRLKARIPLTDGNIKVVQGVRDIFEIKDSPEQKKDGASEVCEGKIVVIGSLEHSYFSVVER
jgi:G3E family GTPase